MFQIFFGKLGSICQTNVPLKSTRQHNTNTFKKKRRPLLRRQTKLCSKQSESYKCNARSNHQKISDELLNIEQKLLESHQSEKLIMKTKQFLGLVMIQSISLDMAQKRERQINLWGYLLIAMEN